MLSVLSSKLKAVIDALGRKRKASEAENPGAHETREGKLKFPKIAPRMVRVRLCGERGIKGPAFIPARDFHHVSRQTCRAALRGIAFAQMSKQYPHMSRRTRRAVASINAQLEYIRMMKDETNAIQG